MKLWKKVGLVSCGIATCLLTWGLVEPYLLDIEERTAVIPNLPEKWQGKVVAQISDFQVGMWMDNVATVRRSVETLIKRQPAAVLISGDFIYHAQPRPSQEIEKVVEIVKALPDANIPTYAVLGNHDYGHKPPQQELGEQLQNKLEQAGIVILENEAIPMQHPDRSETPLYLVGIGSMIANNDQIGRSLAYLPDNSPRIVMMHNPESFKALPPGTAPFAIAGHTHGGQIRLPFLPDTSWISLVKQQEVYGDGWIPNYGSAGNQLYVNRGIGFSDVPIRINCAPEVTLFTLTSDNAELSSS